MRPGPRHAQPRAEARSGLRAIRRSHARKTAFARPGNAMTEPRAIARRAGGSPRPRRSEKDDGGAARDRDRRAGGQGRSKPTTGDTNATTQHDTTSSVVRRTLRRPAPMQFQCFKKEQLFIWLELAAVASRRCAAPKSVDICGLSQFLPGGGGFTPMSAGRKILNVPRDTSIIFASAAARR